MKNSTVDIEVHDFARLLDCLEDSYPISNEFEIKYGQKKKTYLNQKEHMVDWFDSSDTMGTPPFSRNKPQNSAKNVYSRLSCPEALIWIAEGFGEKEEILNQAVNEAKKFTNKRKQSAVVRKLIPWNRIIELIKE